MKIFTTDDTDISVLKESRIVVAGYGNQGRPQALNLRDSGMDVSVAARPGREGSEKAREDGFDVYSIEEGASRADLMLLLLPDEVHNRVYRQKIAGKLREGAALCFAHGFTLAFGGLDEDVYDWIMVAPKGQGNALRENYLEGFGLPCLFSVEVDATGKARDIALAIVEGLGCARAGAIETTAREEAVSDLFGEQAVLCGGVPALVKQAFDLLVRRGFSAEVAYFECLHELKIIVDLMVREGLSGMRELISSTAAYGSLRYGEEIITEETVKAMEQLFDFIERGEFAEDWMKKSIDGKELVSLKYQEREQLIEKVGRRVRDMFAKGNNNTGGVI
jgi:ketol-acid reductoisomerase